MSWEITPRLGNWETVLCSARAGGVVACLKPCLTGFPVHTSVTHFCCLTVSLRLSRTFCRKGSVALATIPGLKCNSGTVYSDTLSRGAGHW